MKTLVRYLSNKLSGPVFVVLALILSFNRELYNYIKWLCTSSKIPTFMLLMLLGSIIVMLLILAIELMSSKNK